MLCLVHSDALSGIDKVPLFGLDATTEIINARVAQIIEKLGGYPRLLIKKHDDPNKTLVDPYPSSAFRELLEYHERTRKAVSRAAMTRIGLEGILANEARLLVPAGEAREQFKQLLGSTFWEHTETAYIKLASYWDRVGQLLAFAFFHVRQYERDGFAGVMQQIHQNIRPVDMTLLSQPGWNSLWSFFSAKAHDEGSFSWLASRRNLLVHRMHLRPLSEDEDSELFETMFDNLEEVVRKKLKPSSPQQEIDKLAAQWAKLNALFPCVLDVIERAAETRHKPVL